MSRTEKIGSYIQNVAGEADPFGNPRDPYEVFLEDNFPEPKYTITIAGTGTLPVGDIAAIKAKSKNGKTYLASILGAAIYGANIFEMKSNVSGSTVLYFDTEQNKRNTAKILKRMHQLSHEYGKQSINQLRTFSLREMSTSERWPYITTQVEKRNPTAIIIDGIADLIQDFNDIKESEEIINKLMRLSAEKDCVIICILHTNKAKDDNNMKGHLGTMLVQKAADVFEVVKQGTVFTVKETECRNMPVEDFSFVLDNDGMPQPAKTPIPIKEQMRDNEIEQTLAKVFEGETILQYNEIVRRYKSLAGLSIRTVKDRIKEAALKGYLDSAETGGYRLPLPSAGG